MSIVTERFMAAIADPAVILPALVGLVFGVAFTLAVSEIADRMHRRAHAKRMKEAEKHRYPDQITGWTP